MPKFEAPASGIAGHSRAKRHFELAIAEKYREIIEGHRQTHATRLEAAFLAFVRPGR